MSLAGELWRCFVAVPIGEELTRALDGAVRRWRTRPDLEGLRWGSPQQWHLTLAFIGDVAPSWVDAAVPALDELAARHRPVALRAGGVGAFPRERAARVVWYGVNDDGGGLARLAADVGATLKVETEHPLRPHITLARGRGEPVDIRRWISEAAAPDGVVPVDRVDLVRSHLGSGPAVYETLATSMLGATADD